MVYEKFLGIGISVPPVIGADALGTMKIIQQIGGRSTIRTPTNVPGAVMAFSLPDELPESIVIEVEVPVEVIKEVQVEVISPLSYAAIGVGVVLVVIAGVLFTRKRST